MYMFRFPPVADQQGIGCVHAAKRDLLKFSCTVGVAPRKVHTHPMTPKRMHRVQFTALRTRGLRQWSPKTSDPKEASPDMCSKMQLARSGPLTDGSVMLKQGSHGTQAIALRL